LDFRKFHRFLHFLFFKVVDSVPLAAQNNPTIINQIQN
jgi:hypothetical protein